MQFIVQKSTKWLKDLKYGWKLKHVLFKLPFSLSVKIDEDLTARINMADYKFSFHEKGKVYNPAWMAPEGKFLLACLFEEKGYCTRPGVRVGIGVGHSGSSFSER